MAEDVHKMDPGRAQQALRWPQEDPKDAHGRPRKPNSGKRWPRDGPRKSPTSPQMAPRGSKGCPRTPKEAQHRPTKNVEKQKKIDSMDPREPPSEHNMAQGAPQKRLGSRKLGPREAQGGPKRLQGALKTLQIPTGGLTSQKC